MVSLEERLGAALQGQYTLERELGRGGTATVWLAQDLKHGRPVALKVLRPDVTVALGAAQFLREIRIAARLTHPNILSVHDSGNAGGFLYYIMPYVSGDTLRERIRRDGRLPLDDAVRIVREIADALAYAHGESIIHRDIKPENILFGAGHAVVADFGIAKALSVAASAGTEDISTSRLVLGTPAYMSPEQAAGSRSLDPRTDIYSLGCLLYEMLAGEPPFTGRTAQIIAAKHLKEPVPSLLTIRPELPTWVQTVVERAMAKDRDRRYPTASAFAAALSPPAVTASVAAADRPTGKWIWAGIIALAAVAGAFVLRHRDEVTPVSRPSRSEQGAAASRDPTHLAVLYFDTEGADSNLRSVANGLTEDLIDRLGNVQALSVISANGVRPYRGRAVHLDSVGDALGVGTLVAGTVGGSVAHPRVTVRLIDPETGRQLDSKQIEPSGDVLAVRGRLAEQVALVLREQLGREIKLREQQSGTRNAAAWVLLHRAENLSEDALSLFRSGDTSGASRLLDTADSLLAIAVEQDPGWSDPVLQRGWLASSRIEIGNNSPAEAVRLMEKWMPVAVNYANEVLSSRPDYPPALELRGFFHYYDWQLNGSANLEEIESAERDLRAAAVPGNPTEARAWSTLSQLLNERGSFAEANLAARRAYEADAFAADGNSILFRLYLTSAMTRQWREAEDWCARGYRRFPNDWLFSFCQLTLLYMPSPKRPDATAAWRLVQQLEKVAPPSERALFKPRWRMMAAGVLARAGAMDSARRTRDAARASASQDPELDFYEAGVDVRLGESARAIELLRNYLRSSPEAKAFIRGDPVFEPLENDPRFQSLVKAP